MSILLLLLLLSFFYFNGLFFLFFIYLHKNVQKGRKEWIEGRERESKHKERVTGDHYKIINNNKFD